MVTPHSPERDAAIIVMLVIGVYVWVMGALLEAFGSWIAASGGALLRYAGFR